MKIRDFSNQFSLLVLSHNIDLGAAVKVHIAQEGYEVFYLSDYDIYFHRLKESTPHCVIFTVSSLKEGLSQFVQKTLEIAPEVKLIPLADDADFSVLRQYEDYGFVSILSEKAPHLEERTLWAVNRACEGLYLTYQNEQLLAELKKSQAGVEDEVSKITELKNQLDTMVHDRASFKALEPLIQGYKSADSKEQVLNLFIEQLPEVKVLFFKYLPSLRSLMITHSSGFPSEKVQGVGCQLSAAEVTDLSSQSALGVATGSLSLMLKQAFGIDKQILLPVFLGDLLEGVFIIPAPLDKEKHQNLLEQFSLFGLAYEKFYLQKRLEDVDYHDPVTEVFNGKYYIKKLNEEVLRSRRLKKAISVVKVAVDDFAEIELAMGPQVRDHVLKTISTLMVKSSRAHDFVARVQSNELVLVLVDCSRKGASIRAERLRRTLETSSILDHGVKLSISVGISEFPALCDSAQSLDATSTKALEFIKSKGGNRICLFKASDSFKPEYEVAESVGEA